MQDLNRLSAGGTAYTAAQVTAALTASTVREHWRFDRLGPDLRPLGDLSAYIDFGSPPEIVFDSSSAVMRTLKIPRLLASAPLNVMTDIIEPHYLLWMPDGTPVDWTLGRFLLTPGERQIEPSATYWQMNGQDFANLLVDLPFETATAIGAGKGYVAAVTQIAAGYGGVTPIVVRIADSGKVLPASLGWEAGITRLKAINDLLGAMGYEPAWFDELGQLRSSPLIDFTQANAAFTFDATGGKSVVVSPFKTLADLSKAFNKCVVIGEDPRRAAVSASYTNNSADSRISVGRWGRTKVKVIKDSKLADVASCAARAKAEVQAAARIHEVMTVPSFPWPLGQYKDVLALQYSTADEGAVNAKFVEEKWTHRCATGALTDHVFSLVVAA